MCFKDTNIIFQDATIYGTHSIDLGLGKVEWFFGNTNNLLNPGYATGSPVQYNYGAYGEYVLRQVVTTPYGCILDTLEQNIHVFALHTIASYFIPAPPDPPKGCVPLDVGVRNFKDSLKTSSPITDYIWTWDYDRVKDTSGVDTLNTKRVDQAEHTYKDTGEFNVWLTLINEQGCRDSFYVSTFWVGAEPVCDFTFEYLEDCRSVFSVRVVAYDSFRAYYYDTLSHDPLVVDTIWNLAYVYDTISCNPLIIDTIVLQVPWQDSLIQINPYGAARADEWTWWDVKNPMAPIANGEKASLSFSTDIGYQSTFLIPLHNGCEGVQVQIDSIGYLCPPIATIADPTDNPDGTKPVFCEYPCFGFADASIGAMMYEWYMGDTINGLRATPGMDDIIGTKPPNFNGQTKLGPLYWFRTWDTGEDSVMMINTWMDTTYRYDSNFVVIGGVVWINVPDTVERIDTIMKVVVRGDTIGTYPDTIPSFCYGPPDSLRRDTNFYIFQNGGVVIIVEYKEKGMGRNKS
jgi:hypothetical protein